MASEVNTEKFIADLRQVIRDAEELLRATANVAGEKVAQVRARAEESLRNARARLAEMGDDLSVQARDAADCTDRYVRTNPWAAMGIAAAAGLLLGVLLSRGDD